MKILNHIEVLFTTFYPKTTTLYKMYLLTNILLILFLLLIMILDWITNTFLKHCLCSWDRALYLVIL
jgi:hypothetical protein